MKSFMQGVRWLAPPAAVFLLVIGVWQLATTFLHVPAFLFPTPTQVFKIAVLQRASLWKAVGITGTAASLGFLSSLVIGFCVALLFSQSAIVRRSFYPYAIFLQTVPIVAIAPLIVIWFGSGFQSVVLVSFLIGLFPIITNTTTGLLGVESRYLELFEIYNASRWQILWKLRVPNCIPFLVAGAKTSSGLSVIGAIVGELFVGFGSSYQGLAYYITQGSTQLKTDLLFASVLACTGLGLAVFVLVNLISQRVLKRWSSITR